MPRSALDISGPDLAQLVEWSRGGGRLAERARVILLSAQGLSEREVSAELGLVTLTVQKWKKRFGSGGLAGLHDLPRPGQPRKLSAERVAELLRLTTQTLPEQALQWSIRRLAQTAGVTEHQVRSIWSAAKIRPKHLKAVELTRALRVDHVELDLAGLYLAPPFSAIALVVGATTLRRERGASGAASRSRPRPVGVDRRRDDGTYQAFAIAARRADATARGRAQDLAQLLIRLDRHATHTTSVYVAFSCAAPMNEPICAAALSEHPALFVHSFLVTATWLNAVESWLCAVETRPHAPRLQGSVSALRSALARHCRKARAEDFCWLGPERHDATEDRP